MVDFNVQRINNRALKTNDRLTFFQIFKWISVGGLLMSMTLSYAWIQHEILTIDYEIQDLVDENAALSEENRALFGQLKVKTNHDTVEEKGRAMGLVPANEESVVIIDADARALLADARSRNQ